MKNSGTLVIVISVAAALTVVGLFITLTAHWQQLPEPKQVPTVVRPVGKTEPADPERIVAVQRVIDQIEPNCGQFASRVRQLFGQLQHPEISEALELPFKLWELNQRNPDRNYPALAQRVAADALQLADINYYTYDVRSAAPGMAATFSPAQRCMYLDEGFDPTNDVDWLVLYHETHHVGQDTRWRAQLDSTEQYRAYLAFHTVQQQSKPRIVLNYETTAYAHELECLNLLVGDELRLAVSVGAYDLERLRQRLNAKAEQRDLLDLLWQFALTYWPEGMQQARLPPPFVRRVAVEYQARGYELYTIEQGNSRIIRPDEL